VGDAEWVANLLDTCRAGDIDLAVENLEWLLGRLKRASKARRSLARIPARQLRAGLAVGSRSESGS
jgi:hypothetical protein